LTPERALIGSLGMSNVLSTDKKQQVIALGKLGWSLRRIEEVTGVRRETASAYLKAAGVAVCLPGWGRRTPAKPAIQVTPDFIAPFSQKQGVSPPSASVCEEYRELIEQGLARSSTLLADSCSQRRPRVCYWADPNSRMEIELITMVLKFC
jgi:hypothetical protein